MKIRLYSKGKKVLFFEKIPFIGIPILTFVLLMGGRKVDFKPSGCEVEKNMQVPVIKTHPYQNLVMDGAIMSYGCCVYTHLALDKLVRIQQIQPIRF